FQDFMRFEMTARENIAVGRVDQPHSESDLEDAAHKSLADEVVRKLSGGYDQILGRRFEGGVELSGGEWQKIALARAYLRDAQLLILDEPTAALDARSELEVFERFAELTLGKMTLLISHRFSTVRMADRIVVLSGGRLIEEGNHEQLMRRGGLYAEMFEMQAASYRLNQPAESVIRMYFPPASRCRQSCTAHKESLHVTVRPRFRLRKPPAAHGARVRSADGGAARKAKHP